MKLHLDPHLKSICVDFTGLRGTIQATPRQMIKAFGEPSRHLQAVPFFWAMQFNDNDDVAVAIATVYLYRPDSIPGDDDLVNWRIGAHEDATCGLVHGAFREAHGLLAQRAA